MYISPFLFIATCLVPFVFANGAPLSQEDSLTPHANLRTREDLAEVSDLHRRARLVKAKPAKSVAAVHKASAFKSFTGTAATHKKIGNVVTGAHKKMGNLVQNPAKLRAVAKANGKTARQPKSVGTKAPAKQSAVHGAACGIRRRVHRRSIFDDLYGRNDDECEIHLNLQNHDPAKSMHSETIKVHNNLGATSGNNLGVYKIDKWNGKEGPFIAKKFLNADDKSKESANLAKVGHLIAHSPKNPRDDSNSWAIMKHVPGKPLIGSHEHDEAKANLKPHEYNAWIGQKHEQVAKTVTDLHAKTGLVHADLKNDNVHWEHHADGSSTPHLLDFGQMAKDADMKHVYRNNGVPADKQNIHDYAMHQAKKMYPLKPE